MPTEERQAIVISATVTQPFEGAAVNILSTGRKYIIASFIFTCSKEGCQTMHLDNSGYSFLGMLPPVQPADRIVIKMAPDRESAGSAISIEVYRAGELIHHLQEHISSATVADGQYVIGSTDSIRITGESSPAGTQGGNSDENLVIWVVFIIVMDMILALFFIRRRRLEHKINEQSSDISKATPEIRREKNRANYIRCFGDFQVFNGAKEDMAQRMSPILKELLILFICSGKEGLTSEKIRGIIWSEKGDKEARNSRNVYITKLRQLIAPLKMEIIYDQGRWFLSSNEVEIDLWTLMEKCESKLNGEDMEKVLEILNGGGKFLQYINYDWLYKYKEDLDDIILLSLTEYMSTLKVKDDPQMIIRIADAMFVFDSLNEQALVAKCKSLKELAKHTVARQIYWLFCKEYRELYGEEYNVSFSSIMTEE